MDFKLRLFFSEIIKMAFRCPRRSGWEGVVDGLVRQVVVFQSLYTEI